MFIKNEGSSSLPTTRWSSWSGWPSATSRTSGPAPAKANGARPGTSSPHPGRLIEGQAAQGWRQAINALSTVFEGRIPDTHAI